MTALRPGDTVVAAKLDRMFRNTEDALRMVRLFREQHVKLVLLDIGGEVTNGGAIAEVFFTLLSAFASFERARISERIRDVKAHAKAKGVKYSRIPPFGWEHAPDKTLREVPSQQEAIRRMLQMREQGATYRDIADTLKAEGVCTLTYEAVRNIIARGGLRPGARP